MSGKLSWKDVLINQLIKSGFSKEESHSVYLVEMEARKYFDFDGIVPSCLMLQNIEQDEKEIRYFWESKSVETQCPYCGTLSTRLSGDYYTKPIQ
ncbi:MAG: hypothetical protein KGZ79_00480, partial [Dethiobacter sp.]|nr:hypothetical protein [Dethiobacter sp.]